MKTNTKFFFLTSVSILGLSISAWHAMGQQQTNRVPPLPPGPGGPPAANNTPESAAKLAEFGDPALGGLKASQGATLLKGGSYQVRSVDEAVFTGSTKRVPYEIYRDDDFNTQIVVTESGDVATTPYRKAFQVRLLGLGAGGYEAIRFSSATGASWRLKEERWHAIAEAAGSNLPFPSEYDIQITDVGGAAVVMRIDVRVGTTWMLGEDSWQLVPE